MFSSSSTISTNIELLNHYTTHTNRETLHLNAQVCTTPSNIDKLVSVTAILSFLYVFISTVVCSSRCAACVLFSLLPLKKCVSQWVKCNMWANGLSPLTNTAPPINRVSSILSPPAIGLSSTDSLSQRTNFSTFFLRDLSLHFYSTSHHYHHHHQHQHLLHSAHLEQSRNALNWRQSPIGFLTDKHCIKNCKKNYEWR